MTLDEPRVQEEIPGTQVPMTKSQLRARELADAKMECDVKREKVKNCERALASQMYEDKIEQVKTQDSAGVPWEFHRDELVKIKGKRLE